jgi:hypothetical protein
MTIEASLDTSNLNASENNSSAMIGDVTTISAVSSGAKNKRSKKKKKKKATKVADTSEQDI